MSIELSPDGKRLLKLIGLYTGSMGNVERWIKNYALWVLVYYGIVKGVFEKYDYTPIITLWYGYLRVVNVSMEAEADLMKLRSLGLVNKLRLATSKYRFITAYMITEKGRRFLEEQPREELEIVDKVFAENGKPAEIIFRENGVPELVFPSGRREEVSILEAEDVTYEATPKIA